MNNKMIELMVALEMFKVKRAHKGQGVIEYAGALVIAAVLVAAVIGVGPDAIKTLFTNLLTSVQTFFTGKMPT